VRSRQEIQFRLKQEAANLRVWLTKPAVTSKQSSPLPLLPDASHFVERLRGSDYARHLQETAERILRHQFPILGFTIETGPEIDWRRDYVHGISSRGGYFRRIPYLDFGKVGDHKIVWELNRHQHLMVLAQAYLLAGDRRYLAEIEAQIESWSKANPFQSGMNWTSALEVAFRALSWIWVYHWVGSELNADVQKLLLTGLYQHGLHLEYNLSVYFSPNTHLLGEAVALHAIGAALPDLPEASRWRDQGSKYVHEQMDFQVREDGSHFEQSSYYHLYAIDLFLLHQVMSGTEYAAGKLERMVEYLASLVGALRKLPFIGDDDGGRVFYPYQRHENYARATLATSAVLLDRRDWGLEIADLYEQAVWWLGDRVLDAQPAAGALPVSRLFPDAGIAVLESPGLHVIVDGGPFGHGSAGHSHSDTLSLLIRYEDEEILVDPGSYTYISDIAQRNWFRGSAAHNTIRIDGLDQASAMRPFGWLGKPGTRVLGFSNVSFEGECLYSGFTHRRRVTLEDGRVTVRDEVEGAAGEHSLEQFWHFGVPVESLGATNFRAGTGTVVETSSPAEIIQGWRSPALGSKLPIQVLRVQRRTTLPAEFITTFKLRR
jgi:hypothetical protein